MRFYQRHQLTILLLVAACCQLCHAAEIERLALVSAIGDTMSVVAYRPGIGSQLDQNTRQIVALPDSTFDDTAIEAAKAAVKRLPAFSAMSIVVPSVDAASSKSTTSAGRLVPSPELQSILRDSGATHLLLLTKHRASSLLKTSRGSTGTGHIEGLGFYIDRVKRLRRSDTGESGTGFLAPFAYFRVSLVDLASLEILKDEVVLASTTLSAARLKEGFDPWEILTAEEKVKLLQQLIKSEVSRVVPNLMSAK